MQTIISGRRCSENAHFGVKRRVEMVRQRVHKGAKMGEGLHGHAIIFAIDQ
jgi:hypothetical protein